MSPLHHLKFVCPLVRWSISTFGMVNYMIMFLSKCQNIKVMGELFLLLNSQIVLNFILYCPVINTRPPQAL